MFNKEWIHRGDFLWVGVNKWKKLVVVPIGEKTSKIVELLKQDGQWQKILEDAYNECEVEKVLAGRIFEQKTVNQFLQAVANKVNESVDIFKAS